MSEPSKTTVWNNYQAAWANISGAERKRLLSESVSSDCSFVSPAAADSGMEALIAHIESFQNQYPGAYFETNKMWEHHDRALAKWTMFSKDGTEFLPGISFACYGPDGRIVQLSGFWEL